MRLNCVKRLLDALEHAADAEQILLDEVACRNPFLRQSRLRIGIGDGSKVDVRLLERFERTQDGPPVPVGMRGGRNGGVIPQQHALDKIFEIMPEPFRQRVGGEELAVDLPEG